MAAWRGANSKLAKASWDDWPVNLQTSWLSLITALSLAYRWYEGLSSVLVNRKFNCIGRDLQTAVQVPLQQANYDGAMDGVEPIALHQWVRQRNKTWGSALRCVNAWFTEMTHCAEAFRCGMDYSKVEVWCRGAVWRRWILLQMHNDPVAWQERDASPLSTLKEEGGATPTSCRAMKNWKAISAII